MLNSVKKNSALHIALRQASMQGEDNQYFALLENELRKSFAIDLLTFSLIDLGNNKARRLYSSDTSSYAIGGMKDIEDNAWTERVIRQQQRFIANTSEELAEVFFDHQLIDSLGLGAVSNWPLVFNGQVIGTVNMLAHSGAYKEHDLSRLEELYPWLLAVFFKPFEQKER